MPNKSCAFSGHRPRKFPWKYDETDGRCVALKAVLTEQIRLLADAGVTQFLSGMAEATDTWSALSVLTLREENPALKLHCRCVQSYVSMFEQGIPIEQLAVPA